MLAWMGGKRSKLKSGKGHSAKQQDSQFGRTGKRAATQELQSPGKRLQSNGGPFKQLCDAAQSGAMDHSKSADLRNAMASAQHALPGHAAYLPPPATAMFSKNSEGHPAKEVTNAMSVNTASHARLEASPPKLPDAALLEKYTSEIDRKTTNTLKPRQSSRQHLSKSHVSLDLQGIALGV